MHFLRDTFWLSAGTWALLAVAYNLLTVAAARSYRDGASRHVLMEKGQGLSVFLRRDVEDYKYLSPPYVAMLLVTYLLSYIIWLYGVGEARNPMLYEFWMGSLLGAFLALDLRQVRLLWRFAGFARSQGVSGRIRYSTWFLLRLSAIEYGLDGLVATGLFLLVGSIWFAGAAFGCLALAHCHWRMASVERDIAGVDSDARGDGGEDEGKDMISR